MSADPTPVPAPRPLKRQPLGFAVALFVFAVWIAFLTWIYLNRAGA